MTKQAKKPTTKTETKVAAKPTIKGLQEEIETLKQEIVSLNASVVARNETIKDMTEMLDVYDTAPWTLITYERFVRWLAKITGYFKE